MLMGAVLRLVFLAGLWVGGKTRERVGERRARKEGSIRLP
jgi:hypothetical protein